MASKAERIDRLLMDCMRRVRDHVERPIDPSGAMLCDGVAGIIDEVRAILVEPDAPASDAGAEIVAMLRLPVWADEECAWTDGKPSCLAKAEEIHARAKSRRVVVVELTDDVEADIRRVRRPGWEDESWERGEALDRVRETVLAAYDAQHGKGGA